MPRVVGSFVVALALCALRASGEDGVKFRDTPLLTSLWEATSQSDNDAIYQLLNSSASAIAARSSDGRGLAWWAWEYQNAYALAAINAFGGDMESAEKDLKGKIASQMCSENSKCNKDELVKKATALVKDLESRKAFDQISEDFKNNEAIVVAAVRGLGVGLRYASEELKNNPQKYTSDSAAAAKLVEETLLHALRGTNPAYAAMENFKLDVMELMAPVSVFFWALAGPVIYVLWGLAYMALAVVAVALLCVAASSLLDDSEPTDSRPVTKNEHRE